MTGDSEKVEGAAPVLETTAEEERAVEPTAAERLRAFEDKILGKDVPRIDGKIERGIGSKFANMIPAHKAAHVALERLVSADDRMTRAQAELDAAKLEQSAAAKAVQGHGNA